MGKVSQTKTSFLLLSSYLFNVENDVKEKPRWEFRGIIEYDSFSCLIATAYELPIPHTHASTNRLIFFFLLENHLYIRGRKMKIIPSIALLPQSSDSIKSLLASRNNSKSSYEIEDCNFYFWGYPSQFKSDKDNQPLCLA